MRYLCFLYLSPLLFLLFPSAQAQPGCGIYRSYEDFMQQTISLPADPSLGRGAVRVSDLFLRPYVYVRTDSTHVKVPMDSIYALRCGNGRLFRVYQQQAYEVVDTGSIKIYTTNATRVVRRWRARGYRFFEEPSVRFFFSTDYRSPIEPLTLNHLRLALPLDTKAEALLAERFPDDASLCKKSANQFLINQFIEQLR
ncbi:MAG: hypothetical protein AB7C90_04965 [Bacteroidales bacterium]